MDQTMPRALLALIALTIAAILLYMAPHAAAQGSGRGADMNAAVPDSTLIARGAYLAKVGDCAGCHTATASSAPFAGGLGLGSPFGMIYSTNITPDKQTGIGDYNYADFERALRDGVRRDGQRLYPAMPYPSFTKISDPDMRALYAYFMHGVPPVSNRPPKTRLPFPFSQRWGLIFWDMVFVRHERFTPVADHDVLWNRGAYIVQSLGHCGACHTPRGPGLEERGYDESSNHYLAGGVNDHWYASNLGSDMGSGLGRLSERDIASFLKTGHGAKPHIVTFGSMLRVVEISTQYYKDDDLKAVAHYLKSLPAREQVGTYKPDSLAAQQTVASLKTGDVERPGAGLYMSFCVKCHQANGQGTAQKFPALSGNPAVLAPDTTSLIRLLLKGGASPQTLSGPKQRKMPPFEGKFTDTEIARILTFVRTTWGNDASAVTARDVSTLRAKLRK